jgi:peroxiredoxin Q/BCP
VEVVGVSGDAVESHQLFKKIKKLGFTLLADEKGKVAKLFGVPYGKGGTFPTQDDEGKNVTLKRGVTIKRWTFIIGKDGTIVYKDTNVDASGDSKKVLEWLAKSEK